MGSKQTPKFKQKVEPVALTSGLSRKQVASDLALVGKTHWLLKN